MRIHIIKVFTRLCFITGSMFGVNLMHATVRPLEVPPAGDVHADDVYVLRKRYAQLAKHATALEQKLDQCKKQMKECESELQKNQKKLRQVSFDNKLLEAN